MGASFDRDRARWLIDTLRPDRLTRIVDIGANPINENPYRNLLDMGGCEVWGFEPQQSAYEKLIAADRPREHYLPYAIGSGRPATLHLCKGSGFTSLLAPNMATFRAIGHFVRGARVIATEVIETRRLDDLDELPDFDLLKIDVQGGETAVYEGGQQKLSRAVVVISEVAAIPLYVDQPLLDAQMAALRGHGFHLHRFLFWAYRMLRQQGSERLDLRKMASQLIDGDAVFVRGLLALETLETEQLKHLAVLADGVFGSQDLAVVALSQLASRGVVTAEAIESYADRLPFTSSRQGA